MTASIATFGSEIATSLRLPSGPEVYESPDIVTLQDLLDRIGDDPNAKMFRSAANKFAEFQGKLCSDIRMEALASDGADFREYLRERTYARNSVRSYSNYINMLVAAARRLGWEPTRQIPPSWEPVVKAMRRGAVMLLIRHLVKKGYEPSAVRESDLSEWTTARAKQGLSHSYSRASASELRKYLIESGLNTHLAAKKVAKPYYGMRLDQMPDQIRLDIHDILRWKQDTFVAGRPAKAHVRPISANNLENAFRRLIGFATNELPKLNLLPKQDFTHLGEVVTEPIVAAYINWGLSTRGVKNDTIHIDLARIKAALGRNPKYSHISGTWLPALLSCIPEDSEEDIRRRKEEKYLSYEVLRQIPTAIRNGCPPDSKADARTRAIAFRDALLLDWMLTLPWRQRNHREIRIGGNRPNLFKARVPASAGLSKPDWLLAMEKTDPDAEVWQISFSKNETKTHHEVRCILPRELSRLVEVYLSEHRKHLVSGTDPGTLFLNNAGTPFNARTFGALVGGITLRYGGRTVSPHLFRDIFAFMWLKTMPEDYLTLSKLLWHKKIDTTIRKYGWMCNESSALCRMERVLGL